MQPTRKTQPYRDTGSRGPGPTLDAMTKGAPAFLPNPMDYQRMGQKGSQGRVRWMDLLMRL